MTEHPNFVRDCTQLLGKFGIWIRDAKFCVFEGCMNMVAERMGIYAIGDRRTKDTKQHIGERKKGQELALYAAGGLVYKHVKSLIHGWIKENSNKPWLPSLTLYKGWDHIRFGKGVKMPRKLKDDTIAECLNNAMKLVEKEY